MVPGLKTPFSKVTKGDWIVYNDLISKLPAAVITDFPTGIFRLMFQVVTNGKHKTCAGSISIGIETIEFSTANQKQVSTTFLTAFPAISSTGLDCNIIVTCLDRNGHILIHEVLVNGKCRWDESSKKIQVDQETWKLSTAQILTSSTCEVNDIVRKGASTIR